MPSLHNLKAFNCRLRKDLPPFYHAPKGSAEYIAEKDVRKTAKDNKVAKKEAANAAKTATGSVASSEVDLLKNNENYFHIGRVAKYI